MKIQATRAQVVGCIWILLFTFGSLLTAPALPLGIILMACSVFLIRPWGWKGVGLVCVSALVLGFAVADEIRWMCMVPTIQTRATLTALSFACDEYHDQYGHFPEGSLKEMIPALLGQNPRKITFATFNLKEITRDGTIIDGWKAPIVLKRADGQMTFRSAGPDRAFETDDDITQTIGEPRDGG